jgi:YHS domain-containing protein
MADKNSLADRIDAQFMAVAEKIKKAQSEQLEAHKGREKRLEQLGKLFAELIEIWRPKLEMLVAKFGERVKVTPRFVPSTREAIFDFKSSMAHVRLKLAAFTDVQVQKLVLAYDLQIIPVLMKFTPHAEIEFPLDAVDKDAIAEWIDDRLVDFVQTYLSMGENEFYLKDQMVEDPIAHVRFPNIAAGATLDWGGKKYYFIGEETRREFATHNKLAIE